MAQAGRRRDFVISAKEAEKADAPPAMAAGSIHTPAEKSRYGMIPVMADGLKTLHRLRR